MKHWYNNGQSEIKSKVCPEGFVLGRLFRSRSKPSWNLGLSKRTNETLRQIGKNVSKAKQGLCSGKHNPMYNRPQSSKTKSKISASLKGKGWYTDGIQTVRAYECPPGFRPGRKLDFSFK